MYEVSSDWPEKLFKQYKLGADVFEEYLVRSRDRVPMKKRNLAEVQEGEERLHVRAEILENTARIRGNPELYKPFKRFPAAEAWLDTFRDDQLRYAMCLILGASRTGKTELGCSWFQNPLVLKVGSLTNVFPAKMREYKRRIHDAIVLDDIRDLEFLNAFQHVFQGKYDHEVSFSDGTVGGAMAYHRLLFGTPFVATCNFATRNLDFLKSHDFCGKVENVLVLHLTETPWEDSGGTSSSSSAGGAGVPLQIVDRPVGGAAVAEEVGAWDAQAVSTFFNEQGLQMAAARLFRNDVNGDDLVSFDEHVLTAEPSFSVFHAKKILAARDRLLRRG